LTDEGYELELRFPWVAFADPAVPGAKMAFNLAMGAQVDPDAGGRQLQCILNDVFVEGSEACGFRMGEPAQPYCDDRTWCQPAMQP
jgi:hypothetical protein